MKCLAPEVLGLRCAVAAVMRQNRALRDLVARGREALTASPPLSRALNCEFNGAHALIEQVATAFKRLPRGQAEAQVPLLHLTNSSQTLLMDLAEGVAAAVPDAPPALARAFRRAVSAAMDAEQRAHNFLSGVSGAGPELSEEAFRRRVDNLVRDMKRAFAALNAALADMEEAATGEAARAIPPKARRHYRTRQPITLREAAALAGVSLSTAKRLDRNPQNSNWPGRGNAKLLIAWGALYRQRKIAAREVRAANRPMHR